MDKLKILVVDDEKPYAQIWCAISWKEKDMLYSKPETVWKQWTFFMRKKILH